MEAWCPGPGGTSHACGVPDQEEAVPTDTLIGFIITGVVVAVFLLWTAHELRRVVDPDDESLGVDDEDQS